jgi:sec-independent protein translocase protein TatA
MIGSLGAPELLIILAVVILIFGIGRISGLGRELGSSIKEFRKAVKDEKVEEAPVQQAQVQPQEQTTVQQAPVQPQPQPAPPPAQSTSETAEKPNVF